jgi:ATP-binding cassette, subfamily F, member 3
VLTISHDRYFPDHVVELIVELEEGQVEAYAGDYTYYWREKARRTRMGTP